MSAENTMLYIDKNKLSSITDFSFLPSSITANMLQQLPAKLHSKSVDKYNVFELKNQTYAIGDGFFDVLQWNDTVWTNLYTSPYLGYNFLRKIFTYKGEIYALGGYGYWHNHSNLIKFDTELSYWTMIITKGKPNNYYSECISKIGDTIISVFGKFVDESINLSEVAKNGYMLNLNNMVWHEINQDIQLLYGKNTYFRCFYDLADYSVIELSLTTKHGYYVLDKSTLEMFFYKRDAIDLTVSPFVLIDGNKATFNAKNNELITIDFTTIVPNEKLVGNLVPAIKQSLSKGWILVIGGAILIIFIIIIILKKRSHVTIIKGKGNDEEQFINELTEIILKRKGEILDLNELNILFGIENLTTAKRRVERSKLINDINYKHNNTTGTDLIFRLKDGIDKRYVRYKLG